MKRDRLLLILIAAVFAGTFLAYLVYHSWYVVEVHETAVTYEVIAGQHIGFAADSDHIRFGKVVPGGSATREVLLRSAVPSIAVFSVSESLAGSVHPGRDKVPVLPGNAEKITIRLSVSEDAVPGNYSGTLSVTYLRKLW